MKNRVIVTIAGQEFTLVAEESAEYMDTVAARVDKEINQVAESFRGSSANIAILACLNLADALIKAQETSEGLRSQLKDYLEESARMKAEVAEMRREMGRIRRQQEFEGTPSQS